MSGGYFFSVWLHILAAAIWIGGMVFLALVVIPVLRKEGFQGIRTVLLHESGRKFRTVGWIAYILLIITGLTNLGFRGYGFEHLSNGSIWQGSWGQILGWKIGFVVLVLLLSAFHDFYLGPKATRMLEEDERSTEAQRIRKAASYMGRFSLVLSLVILALAIMLVRGGL